VLVLDWAAYHDILVGEADPLLEYYILILSIIFYIFFIFGNLKQDKVALLTLHSKYKKLIAGTVYLFIMAYVVFSVGLLWQSPVLVALYFVILILSYLALFRDKSDIAWFFAAAVVGTLAELMISASGLLVHSGYTILAIPYWIPLFWGFVAVTFKRLISFFE
jgi:hypothetical protein